MNIARDEYSNLSKNSNVANINSRNFVSKRIIEVLWETTAQESIELSNYRSERLEYILLMARTALWG